MDDDLDVATFEKHSREQYDQRYDCFRKAEMGHPNDSSPISALPDDQSHLLHLTCTSPPPTRSNGEEDLDDECKREDQEKETTDPDQVSKTSFFDFHCPCVSCALF